MSPKQILFSCLLLLIHLAPVHAQQIFSRTYPRVGTEQIGSAICLRDGSVLMGARRNIVTVNASPYLVHTNADGDTLWTRRYSFLNGSATQMVEDNAGRVLLLATEGPRGQALLLDQATGDTVWTRRLSVNGDTFAAIGVASDQSFILAATIQNRPTLLRLSPTGQLLWQTTVFYSPAEVGVPVHLARGSGGYWLLMYSNHSGASSKVVFVSNTGVRGAEYNLPTPANFIVGNFLAVENGNFLVTGSMSSGGGNFWYKFSPSFATIWNRPVQAYTNASSGLQNIGVAQISRNTNGEYVILSIYGYSSHTDMCSFFSFDAQGAQVRETILASFRAGLPRNPLKFAVSPVSGDYYLATHQTNSATNDVDLMLSRYRGAAVTATTPSAAWAGQLYPNPVGANATLQLQPAAPLAGTLVLTDALGRAVRQWPVRPAATRYELPLQGLSTGVYQLCLTDQQGRRAVRKVLVD